MQIGWELLLAEQSDPMGGVLEFRFGHPAQHPGRLWIAHAGEPVVEPGRVELVADHLADAFDPLIGQRHVRLRRIHRRHGASVSRDMSELGRCAMIGTDRTQTRLHVHSGAGAMLKLGLPKGSLESSTFDLFRRAGFHVSVNSRSYFPEIDDEGISCTMFRAQEMARYVEDGVVDVGITGHDWVVETGADVVEVAEMTYSKATSRPARWVLAVPAESHVSEIDQLEGGVIATELVRTTREYFEQRGIDVRVEFSWGATEVKARIIDAIVDVTETGSSLRANNLRVIAEVLTSTVRLIANREAWNDPARREKIEAINTLLQGAIAATTKVGLKLNTPRSSLEDVLAVIGRFGEHAPTISPLIDDSWVALEIILDERQEREMIPELRRAGASGLVSYPLNKVIS